MEQKGHKNTQIDDEGGSKSVLALDFVLPIK